MLAYVICNAFSAVWMLCRCYNINDKHRAEYNYKSDMQRKCKTGNIVIEYRTEAADCGSTRYTKEQYSRKTDASAEIYALGAVIPPALTVKTLDKHTGKILHRSAQYHCENKYERRIRLKASEE